MAACTTRSGVAARTRADPTLCSRPARSPRPIWPCSSSRAAPGASRSSCVLGSSPSSNWFGTQSILWYAPATSARQLSAGAPGAHPMARLLELTLNGRRRIDAVPDNLLLLDYLREQVGLTGTKTGCDGGE